MERITLDFETATNYPDSPCEMGLAIVRNGQEEGAGNWRIESRKWAMGGLLVLSTEYK